MDNRPRLLFFQRDSVPTKEEREDIKKQVARGFRVDARNAIYAKTEGALEPCDAIAGSVAPQAYQDAYPWADDFDPESVAEVGDEWVDDDGVAYVRAVRGDGIAYNMPLSIAAPGAIGSGAPTHGPFAGFDHAERIRREQAEGAADEPAGDGEGEDTGTGTGEGEAAGSEGGATGQNQGQGAGEGAPATPPAAADKPQRKAKRKPAAAWRRNA